jgi:DNA-binding beta-propeller fold protein YncE
MRRSLALPLLVAAFFVVHEAVPHGAPPRVHAADTAPVASVAAPSVAPLSTGTLGEPLALPSPLPAECTPQKGLGDSPAVAPPGASYKRLTGRRGMGLGELAYPRAVVCGDDGTLFVVDKRGRLQVYGPDFRAHVLVHTPQLLAGAPTGLALSHDGKLLVADTHYARVLTYSRDLTLESSWGRPGSRAGGFLYLADAREGPGGVFYTLDYFNEHARLQIWRDTPERPLERVVGRFGESMGEFKRPMALAIDEAHKELVIAEAENHRIQVLGLDGTPKRVYGTLGEERGQLKFPYDVSVDEEGRAWVVEFGNHRLQVFDREGHTVGLWGSPGRGEGELAEPWALALGPRGLVYVVDAGNDRIYELDRSQVLGH